MRSASLVLSDDQVTELQAIVARHTNPQRMVMRARTVLLVAAGSPLRSTARMLECRPATVRKWCRRFHASGLAGLADACRPGRPRQITAMERCSVIATACDTPQNYGLEGYSVWSGALLARVLTASGRVAQISERSVQRVLKRASLKPTAAPTGSGAQTPTSTSRCALSSSSTSTLPPMGPSSAPTKRPASRRSNAASRTSPSVALESSHVAKSSTAVMAPAASPPASSCTAGMEGQVVDDQA